MQTTTKNVCDPAFKKRLLQDLDTQLARAEHRLVERENRIRKRYEVLSWRTTQQVVSTKRWALPLTGLIAAYVVFKHTGQAHESKRRSKGAQHTQSRWSRWAALLTWAVPLAWPAWQQARFGKSTSQVTTWLTASGPLLRWLSKR
jgi:hypothetical protein